ncbi:aldolase [Aquincola sp. S2]|uniref:Aldolase n=1 Tax=Pseudaquabacterium terrae TaxID=2732868 RepID=A0ABX2EUH7_9BURK|nr:aldolase [Aquabacterium terrae]NRF72194.1 aldolase [Aquabacterium terrae]
MASTLSLSKDALVRQALEQMQTELPVAQWTPRQQVALTCRILFDQGHDSGLAGQITARGVDGSTFLTQRLGLGFDEVTASNLLRVDEDLTVVEGSGMPNPANRFHSWIYRARPDVRCVIHTHPLHVSALSMLERPLQVSHMDACMLYDDVAFLAEWPGVPVGNSEGELIAGVLGNKRAALLAHHGLVVAGTTIEEACVVAVQCERAARLQLLAMAAGEIKPIAQPLAREAHDWILQPRRSQAGFDYFARRALRKDPNCVD